MGKKSHSLGAVGLTRIVTLGFIRLLLFFTLIAVFLFTMAGRLGVPGLWVYLGLLLLGSLTNIVAILKTDPTLLAERMRPGAGGRDPLLRYMMVLLFATHLAVAALDVGRFHFSDTVPLALRVIGFIGYACALGLSCWSMYTNRFFSSDVRVQHDRNHVVITGGPYRYIRHPGYAAAFLMGIAGTLALGSWGASLPAIPALGLTVRRLLLEEQLLRAELPGYRDYMARVRWRIFPGIW